MIRRRRDGTVQATKWLFLPLLAACTSNDDPAPQADAGTPQRQDGSRVDSARDGFAESARDAANDSGGPDSHDAGGEPDADRQPDSGPACPAVPESGDPATFMSPAVSCAYSCPISPSCGETTTPYQCQNLGAWGCIPHAATCGDWDGSYPAVVPGKCSATVPTGNAIKYAGADPTDATQRILPDGRHMKPAGQTWIFSESDLDGGLTTGIIGIPGTTYVLTVDTGNDDHAVRLIDTTKIGSGATPVVSYVKFPAPSTLNSSIAFRTPDLVLVTTDDGNIQALAFNQAAGTIAVDAARSLTLPHPTDGTSVWYAASVAVSPDGTRAVVTGVTEPHMLVVDVAAGSATYGTVLGSVDLGQAETFQVAFDPADAAGTTAYVSMWSGAAVLAVDVSNPASPKVSQSFATGKDPEGMAFLDSRWMVVANDLGDSLSLIDRLSATVTSVPLEASPTAPGLEPIGVAFDAAHSLLYAPFAATNAVAAFNVDLSQTPPTIVPAGALPTSWWPSGVVVMPDGSVVVASMQGNGSGPDPMQFDIGSGDIADLMRGGIQYVPAPSASDLTRGAATVEALDNVESLAGYPTVSCPAGSSDFPLPATNTDGPSPAISHVFLIIRENKSFDGLFGDFPNVAGDPSYTLKTLPGEMDVIWANFRGLARTFAMADNFYNDAIYSIQGHMWTTYGRSDDFDERTWAVTANSRNARPIPGAGVSNVGQPAEGSLFDWLGRNGVEYNILGEIVGLPSSTPPGQSPVDTSYPGGPFQSIPYDDDEKACHIAGRARVTCDFGSFVYATLPNDHTLGIEASSPAPETFCAVNDDATGMAIDAITHSPLWASSVIFVTEDDPSQGGEHIDSHRSPLVIISPWVKRAYVSQTHFDISSLHRMFAHIFGKPYPNNMVANAALPFDLFTSTPDFTPYTYVPRKFPLYCGEASTQVERRLTRSWDFSDPDEQPGLDRQVMRWMRGAQLDRLSPRQEREIEARWEKRLESARQPTPSAGRTSRTGPVPADDGDDPR